MFPRLFYTMAYMLNLTHNFFFGSDNGRVRCATYPDIITSSTYTITLELHDGDPIPTSGAFFYNIKSFHDDMTDGESRTVYQNGTKSVVLYREDSQTMRIKFMDNGTEVTGTSLSTTTFSAYVFLYLGFTLGYYDSVLTWFAISYYRYVSTQPDTSFFRVTSLSVNDPTQNTALFNWIGDDYKDIEDPYGLSDNNETPSGGFGDFDYGSDDVLPPSLPSVSAAQVGFVSLWNPSAVEMKDLADYLWTGTFDLTNFKKLFTDPMECVLSVGIIPVTPTTGTATEIIFGGSSHSGVNAKPITNQFVLKDFGKLHIEGKSKSFMDYSPYSKASIFLPYCGTYALDVDEIMDADIYLEYHIDIYTGACVAYLTIKRVNSDGKTLHSTLYQFTGNVLATIPVTGADHSAFLQSLLFMGASMAATVATSGAGAPALEGAAASGDVAGASALNAATAGSAINTVMSMKPNVLHSGNLSSTAGFLGQQTPFITMTWSNLCRPEDEQKLVGMPDYKSGTLSDFEGFTVVTAVHMDSILCTDAELKMIEQALYKGVII